MEKLTLNAEIRAKDETTADLKSLKNMLKLKQDKWNEKILCVWRKNQ